MSTRGTDPTGRYLVQGQRQLALPDGAGLQVHRAVRRQGNRHER